MTTLQQVLLPSQMVIAFYSFAVYSALTRRIREAHPTVWQDLGSPSLLAGNSAGMAVVVFVLSGAYRKLNDPRVAVLARRWRNAYVLFLAGCGVFAYTIFK